MLYSYIKKKIKRSRYRPGVDQREVRGIALPPGKTRYPLYRRLGGPQGRSGWAERPARSQTLYRLSYRARIRFLYIYISLFIEYTGDVSPDKNYIQPMYKQNLNKIYNVKTTLVSFRWHSLCLPAFLDYLNRSYLACCLGIDAVIKCQYTWEERRMSVRIWTEVAVV
jgi:hypothetical protein